MAITVKKINLWNQLTKHYIITIQFNKSLKTLQDKPKILITLITLLFTVLFFLNFTDVLGWVLKLYIQIKN